MQILQRKSGHMQFPSGNQETGNNLKHATILRNLSSNLDKYKEEGQYQE